jgi:uncharacterized membrane protein
MSTLFAFLHHVAAFTLVSTLAVELVLIRQELTLANARKLPVVDAVLGGSGAYRACPSPTAPVAVHFQPAFRSTSA